MLKLIQGSFLEGCGVIVRNVDTDGIYHLIVHKEKETDKLFVEIGEQKFYEEQINPTFKEEIEMTNLRDCVEIINEPTFVLIKVKEGKEMDMIMTGLFEGDETMFRITKGNDHNCTTWYKDGRNWSWHHGVGGCTCVTDSVWKKWKAIESMIKNEGINIEKCS